LSRLERPASSLLPALEGVLNEIETRAAVEMAKLEMLAPAA